jgi:hypothetical protein
VQSSVPSFYCEDPAATLPPFKIYPRQNGAQPPILKLLKLPQPDPLVVDAALKLQDVGGLVHSYFATVIPPGRNFRFTPRSAYVRGHRYRQAAEIARLLYALRVGTASAWTKCNALIRRTLLVANFTTLQFLGLV